MTNEEMMAEIESLKQQLSDAQQTIQALEVVTNKITEQQAEAYKGMNTIMREKMQTAFEKVTNGYNRVYQSTLSFIDNTSRVAANLGDKFFDACADNWKTSMTAVNNMKLEGRQMFDKWVVSANNITNNAIEDIKSFGNTVIADVKDSPTTMKMQLIRFEEGIKERKDAFVTKFNEASEKFEKAYNNLCDRTYEKLISGKQAFKEKVEALGKGISGVAKAGVTSLVSLIKEGIETDRKTYETIKFNIEDLKVQKKEINQLKGITKEIQREQALNNDKEGFKTSEKALKTNIEDVKDRHKNARKEFAERD